jgi:hypothetical protein
MHTDGQPIYGELTACNSALVFQPSPEHETFQLRLQLPSILGATVTPFKRRLMIQSEDRPYWFSGPSVAPLGQRLMSLLEPSDQTFSAGEAVLASGPAKCGVLQGNLLLTTERLLFQAVGGWALFAAFIGQPSSWEMSHAELISPQPGELVAPYGPLTGPGVLLAQAALSATPLLGLPARWRQGWRRGRGVLLLHKQSLELVTDQEQTSFPLRSLQSLKQSGSRLRIGLDGEPPLWVQTEPASLLLRRITDALLDHPMQSIRSGHPDVIWWRSQQEAVIGQLSVRDGTLQFQDATGAQTIQEPLASLKRCPAPMNQIRLASDKAVYHFEPSLQEGFMENFWKSYHPPQRTLSWPASPTQQRKLLQGQRSVWLSDQDDFDVLLQPGMLLERPDGFGVMLPPSETPPQLGTTLRVELGKPDGVYQFEATLLRLEPLPPTMRFARSGRIAVLSTPAKVHFYNQRSAFRVPMKMSVSAWRLRLDKRRGAWIPDGDRLCGQLLNLSISGCGLHTDAKVAVGEHLFLELLIDEHWVPLEAECVRSEPGFPEGSSLGLHFLNLPERLERMLNQTVLKQQRCADGGMMPPE